MNWKLKTFHVTIILVGLTSFLPPCHGQVGAPATTASSAGGSEDADLVRRRFAEYERQLNAMLKTRRDEERAFVGSVVSQIRLGNIPSKLVSTSFEWVRNKRPDTKYPFVYFERVLRLQAARLGLGDQIPEFDYGIYSELTEPVARTGAIGEDSPETDAVTLDATESNRGFDFFRRALTRVVPFALDSDELPDSTNVVTEPTGGEGIFNAGGFLDGFRR